LSRRLSAPDVVLIPPENLIATALSKKGRALQARLLRAQRKNALRSLNVGSSTSRGPPGKLDWTIFGGHAFIGFGAALGNAQPGESDETEERAHQIGPRSEEGVEAARIHNGWSELASIRRGRRA